MGTQAKKSDKQIKSEATKSIKRLAFDDYTLGRDIRADCSDGQWIRKYWKNCNGYFGWLKWEKL